MIPTWILLHTRLHKLGVISCICRSWRTQCITIIPPGKIKPATAHVCDVDVRPERKHRNIIIGFTKYVSVIDIDFCSKAKKPKSRTSSELS